MTEHNTAVVRAYNAAELKANETRQDCGPAPIDHAAQAALENANLTGEGFKEAYNEVFETINTLSKVTTTTDGMANKLGRLKFELQ